jgi:hypothetical protein
MRLEQFVGEIAKGEPDRKVGTYARHGLMRHAGGRGAVSDQHTMVAGQAGPGVYCGLVAVELEFDVPLRVGHTSSALRRSDSRQG